MPGLWPGFFLDIYNMCGIAGIISSNPNNVSKQLLKQMTDVLAHRGPDGEGQWVNGYQQAGFGHRRLSIIDLTSNGAQPMHYLNRYTIIHNGEVYNYIELKEELAKAGYRFSSQTDTEVIVAAYDFYGEGCLKKFDGMFAFAIWDEKEQTLFAARDRFGEKPFYYFENEEVFLFASEMKALWAYGIEKKISNKALLNFLTLGYVHNAADNELTFYENIFALPPAHYLTVTPGNTISVVNQYWKLDKELKLNIGEKEAAERLELLLNSSLKYRLRSDVTIGTSLSGGLDSSTIAASLADKGVLLSTFSAVFPGFEKDESLYVKMVTEKFKLKNFTTTPNAGDLINSFEKLCYHQEEPFSSSSIFTQYKVFELAKQQGVKVLLDGQGADEILAGYHKYIHWYLQELISRNKFGKAKKERLALQRNNAEIWWGIKNIAAAFLPAHASIQLEKREYEHSIHQPDINRDFIRSLRGREWEGIHKPVVTKLNDILHYNVTENGLEELLRFADRNSMAHSREVRLPFLDHTLVQFVFSLPSKYKIQNGFTKWVLRKVMDKKLPDAIVWRKDKTGYEPPQQLWMENKQLQDYIREAKKKLSDKKIITAKALAKKIEPRPAHKENNYDWRYLVAAHLL